MTSSKLYVATFNHGAIEEQFYAIDDNHASEVAHEIAARRKLLFDHTRVLDENAVEPADCAPWAYPRCAR